MVVWLLDGNQIEFGVDEFYGFLKQILEGKKLFEVLKSERPALLDHLLEIYEREWSGLFDQTDLEFILEQALFDLKDRIRL